MHITQPEVLLARAGAALAEPRSLPELLAPGAGTLASFEAPCRALRKSVTFANPFRISIVCSLVIFERAFDNTIAMDFMTKDGERRGVHKMYVNVVLYVNDEGRIDPLAVIWPDGRTFRIDEVLYRGEPGQMQKGAKTSRFRIRFGRKETNLYLERRQGSPALGTPDVDRWWVNAIDNTPTKPSC